MVGGLTIGFYTFIAQIIPQLQSAVPETVDFSGGVTAEVLVSAGDGLFNGAGGCTACHGGSRAPALRADHGGQGPIGARCGDRVSGMICKEYLYASLIDPGAFLVDGFPAIMPDASRQLSQDQLWAVVAYLENQGGTVTVNADDIQAGGGAEASAPAPAAAPTQAAQSFSGESDPMQLLTLNACLGCHAIDGAGPPIGPSFDGIGSRLTADQIRIGILDPNLETAEGFEQFAGIMPPDFGSRLSASQVEAMVRFLSGRQ